MVKYAVSILLLAVLVGIGIDSQGNTLIVWLAPTGTLTETPGNPLYQWEAFAGATSYELYIGTDDGVSYPALFWGTIGADDICSESICSVDVTTRVNSVPLLPWVSNGAYIIWINPQPGVWESWQGPYRFSVNALPPQVPLFEALSAPNTFTWTLEGASARAGYFLIYLARQADIYNPMVYEWFSREQICGSREGTICTFTRNLLPNTFYSFYVESWGPGGLSVGGNAGNWFDCSFNTADNICHERPIAPWGLTPQVNNNRSVTLSWHQGLNTTKYLVWVGIQNETSVREVYFSSTAFSSESLGCTPFSSCTLTLPNPLENGVYRWFVQAQGPGGVPFNDSSGSGWLEGPIFTVKYPYLRQIYLYGQQLGNRSNVFSTVGDSITATPYFLVEFTKTYNLRTYSALEPAVQHFSELDGDFSFTNQSRAAYPGWNTFDLLNPAKAGAGCLAGESPLVCEYRLSKPSVALIMIGTNDTPFYTVQQYRTNMVQIIETTINKGIIPVLSTIPHRTDFDLDSQIAAYNATVRELAAQYGIFLWDFYSEVVALPNYGLHPDKLHMSIPPGAPASTVDFTAENLQYGATLRNLRALQILDLMWHDVMY